MNFIINLSYFSACILLILSIRSLARPATARYGSILGMAGIALAITAAFASAAIPDYFLALAASRNLWILPSTQPFCSKIR